MLNRWKQEVSSGGPLDELVQQSRRVGQEERLVLWGGGNNSVKVEERDLLGRLMPVMYVKGSGSDMRTITPRQFPAVRLDYVLPLRLRDSMSDEEMVDYLARCLVDPKSPRPSIETLLHAFLPARSVLHTHANAILAITNNPGREETVRSCYGDSIVIVPYLRPGFALSRRVAELTEKSSGASGIILMNHGLITWGETPREAYDRHMELVTRAEEFVEKSSSGGRPPQTQHDDVKERRNTAARLAPLLRGEVCRDRKLVLHYDDSEAALAFLAAPRARELTQIGAATPDHLLYTKRHPLFVELPIGGSLADERGAIRAAMESYTSTYRDYFDRNASPGETMLDPLPRVILVPGVGMWSVGKDGRAATIVADIYRQTMQIILAADVLGGFSTLSERDAFDAEYWPLELYKLTLQPKEKELAGHVALVTGAASGIGRATALRLAEEGAHVAVTDVDLAGAENLAAEITGLYGMRRALAIRLDVTDPAHCAHAFRETVLAWGGIDILVSNAGVAFVASIESLTMDQWESSLRVNTTGHFLAVRAALDVLRRQGRGGSIVFVATKNVTAPGRDFGAYSVSKAAEAQLCRIVAIEAGEIGVRANMLNPDAVFEGSKLWSDELRRQRAEAYGLAVEELPDYYRRRNLLQVSVSAEDVAEAALFLAGPRSSRTTGAMIPVDGGVKEAFPR